MNKDGSSGKAANGHKTDAALARGERLKEALRANLLRRKGQAKARKTDDKSENK